VTGDDKNAARALQRRRRYHAQRNDPWRTDGEAHTYMPIEPLLDRFPNLNRQTLARKAGVDPGNFHRMCAAGRIRWDAADRAAIGLGLHPQIIWPDHWPLPVSDDTAERSNRIDNALKTLRQELA
jgi:hypothetical protein